MPNIDSIVASPDFEVYSIIRFPVEPPTSAPSSAQTRDKLYLLQYTLDRINDAAKDLGFTSVDQALEQPDAAEHYVAQIQSHLDSEHGRLVQDPQNAFLIRMAFKKDGNCALMSMPMPINSKGAYYPRSLEQDEPTQNEAIDTLYVDASPTPTSLLTKHKTSHRAEYNQALSRVLGDAPNQKKGTVLLQNDAGEVFGTTFETVYVKRDGGWVTTRSESGCKLGVTRRWALDHIGVKEALVKADSIGDGELVWLSSAANGFCRACVKLTKP